MASTNWPGRSRAGYSISSWWQSGWFRKPTEAVWLKNCSRPGMVGSVRFGGNIPWVVIILIRWNLRYCLLLSSSCLVLMDRCYRRIGTLSWTVIVLIFPGPLFQAPKYFWPLVRHIIRVNRLTSGYFCHGFYLVWTGSMWYECWVLTDFLDVCRLCPALFYIISFIYPASRWYNCAGGIV